MSYIIKSKLKNITVLFCSILFLMPFCKASYSKYTVTDRELLMLAAMSYNNNPQEDVSKMGDEQFNSKWLGEFANPEELDGWKLVDFIINKELNVMKGMSVFTYKKGNDVVIAFRGTDCGIIRENWKCLVLGKQHPQIKYAEKYLERLKSEPFIDSNTKIYITGHSLGGHLALYSLGKLLLTDEFKNKVVRVVTFNGLGLLHIKDKRIIEVLSKVGKDLLVNYAVRGDIVSLIGKHFTPLTYVKTFYSKSEKIPKFVNGNSHFLYMFFSMTPF